MSTGVCSGETTFYWPNGATAKGNTYTLTQTAYMDINGNIIDGVITDKAEKYERSNIKIVQEGKDYVCEVYRLKYLDFPYNGYEIYQNGVSTGIILHDVIGADNHTVIGHESVERVYDNGNHYFDAGKLMMFHIY